MSNNNTLYFSDLILEPVDYRESHCPISIKYDPPELKHGGKIDHYVNELVEIGNSTGFALTDFGGQQYDILGRHLRAREIGEDLNRLGGLRLMKLVFFKVTKKVVKSEPSDLVYAWGDIG